jgi:3-hydroxybutyryl-CoA dehydrogenase
MTHRTVAIIGTGTMGRGLSVVCSQAGMAVRVYDLDTALAHRVADELDSTSPSGGVVATEAISTAVEAADVVIECVPELLAVKAETLSAIGQHARSGTIIATNTSTMSISALIVASGYDGHIIGLHFFNPAEKMRLVEIVRTADTPDDLLNRSEAFVADIGKTSIVVRDSPGFVTSRLGLIMGNEAMRMVEDGIATAEAIDTAMRLGYNHPMGPLELADLVGLDARLNNVRAVYEALGIEAYKPPAILEKLVAGGTIGRKVGHGFYKYDSEGRRIGRPRNGPSSSRG